MKKKIFALVLCVAMLAIAIVGGTLAYFTDNKAATNVFTLGNVNITLTEPSYDTKDGSKDGTIHVYPGQVYDKDPTITVAEGSESCWLVATVTISNKSDLYKLYPTVEENGVHQIWGLSLAGKGKMVSGGVADYAATTTMDNGVTGTMLKDTSGKEVAFLTYTEPAETDTIVYTFYFKQIHEAEAKETLFTKVNIPSIIDNGDISNGQLSVAVKAYAIQSVGFGDVYAAWTAYQAQEPTT